LHVVRREPYLLGFRQSRWTLASIAQACDWLRLSSASGLYRLLRQLGISYKRGREYLRSPDRHYEEKLSYIELCRMRAFYEPERFVFLYGDEMTILRQPSVARDYERVGRHQPLARRAYTTNTRSRVVAVMHAFTGQVNYQQRSHINISVLTQFWHQVRAAYPNAETIYVALDNWPVHFHPDVLVHLQPQAYPWPPKLLRNWPQEPRVKPTHSPWPIQLLALPSYASWLNPIEKLWRWLKQTILHMHRLANDWPELKRRVNEFLDPLQSGSEPLLRYTGLLPT
jgi:hypothetical protein